MHWTPCSGFELVHHLGPYEDWPLETPLLLNGQPLQAKLQGYNLLHQLEHSAGHLLITDFDCPFEEAICFTLLNPQHERISQRVWGAPYASFWLDELFESQAGTLCCDVSGVLLELTLRPWHIPYLLPKLKFHRLSPQGYAERQSGAAHILQHKLS